MQATSVFPSCYATARNKADIRHYFEYSSQGIEIIEDGLEEVRFGEYLVAQGVLNRYQLFRALQMQDQRPDVRLGEAAAALGFATGRAIEQMFARFQGLATFDVD